MRKRLMNRNPSPDDNHRPERDIANLASFVYSSEDPQFPLEHLIDGYRGPGGTRWAGANPNTTECIVLEFEPPQRISYVVYEVEEFQQARTQEVRLEVSVDKGSQFRQILAQDYTFSPQGATFQQEKVHVEATDVTHLRLTIIPNKGGSGTATLTSLRVFTDQF